MKLRISVKNSKIRNLDLNLTENKQQLLAYETGVHLGDGSLQIQGLVHRVVYCGDIENDYSFYGEILPKILKTLYNKAPVIYKRKGDNTIITILNSKEAIKRKVKLGLPIGNKQRMKRIPPWIKDGLVTHFLRGLADADFCLSFKKNRKGIYCEPRIEFFTNNKIIAEFALKSLRDLGFKVAFEDTKKHGFKEYRLRMYGKKMLNEWMKTIGFTNPKQLSKFLVFQKLGYCPIKLSTNERLDLL